MDVKAFLDVLVEEIHSVVIATTDENGLPCTRVIDMMMHDDDAVYFLTAKGKAFYKQLMEKPYVSLSGLTTGNGTMDKKSISISGAIRNIGSEKLEEIFEKNPYMATIYPSDESRTALEVFCLYKGQGAYFDLSTKPITRGSFSLGGKTIQNYGYFITEDCTGCGLCVEKCPQNCISVGEPYKINQDNCLHCGNCFSVCPEKAVIKTILN
ncbi:4Fe-4S binding protein [uncultured Lutibacter sp.]|uniref:4Fe-4S binding protein n=1 Tax=uncultured Lutibacter sp. TaxID=437739 RepID=UPI00260F75CC|nr:4Fe-4S binding protein [uncultured Lutibacter sp.]